MADEPRKIFDLIDTETEPTDEQLAEFMHYVGEAVRAKKKAAGRFIGRNHVKAKEKAP